MPPRLLTLAALTAILAGCPDSTPAAGECTDPQVDCAGPSIGQECRAAVCTVANTCAITPVAGFCFDLETSTCVAAGAGLPANPCRICDPTVTQDALVAKACGAGEVCQAGSCVVPTADAASDTHVQDVSMPDQGIDTAVADVGLDLGPEDVVDAVASDTTGDAAEPAPDVPDVAEPTPDVADAAGDTPDEGDAGLDTTTDAATDTETEIVAPGPSYSLTPHGLTTLGGPSPGSGSTYVLHDQRFIYAPVCGANFCAVGGLTP